MKKLAMTTLVLFSVSGMVCPSARALPPFKKAFGEKYTDKETNPEYFDLVRKTGCEVCHVKGQKKNIQNAYGRELNALIAGDAADRLKEASAKGPEAKEKETAVLLAEFDQALNKVADMENKDHEKWGDRIHAGKLPVPVAQAQEDYEESAKGEADGT